MNRSNPHPESDVNQREQRGKRAENRLSCFAQRGKQPSSESNPAATSATNVNNRVSLRRTAAKTVVAHARTIRIEARFRFDIYRGQSQPNVPAVNKP
jgi:hypothetical protein